MIVVRLLLALLIGATPALAQEAAKPSATFSSAAKANIFLAEKGEMILKLDPIPDGGEITIANELGENIGSQKIPAGAPEVTVPLTNKGFFQLKAQVDFPGSAPVVTEATAAVIGPKLDDAVRMQSRLGLWTVQGDADLVAAAGAHWNRRMVSIHTLGKELLDPNPPPAEKKIFTETPFSQVGVLSFGFPRWLMTPTEKKKSFGNPLTKPTDWNTLKSLVSAWVRQNSENFPEHFEIYNEPEWQWTDGTNEELVRVLATIADGIKEAHPQTKILGPGFSSIRIKDPARLDLVTANKLGLFDHLDGLVVHAYVDGTAPEKEFIERVMELQQFLRDIGRADFPIHITEFGWTTGSGTWQKPVDELTQARYAVRSLTLLAALGIENATYFCLQFKAAPNPGERGFSLVHPDSTPKPSFAAFSNVARWLANVRGLGTWLHITPTTHLVLFDRSDDTSIAVAWDTAAERAIELPLETRRREDMMGRSIASSPTLTLNQSPKFLEFSQQKPPEIEMLPTLRVMRGGDPSALREGNTWIAPAPLRTDSSGLIVPPDAANGNYLLLSQSDDKWLGQPIEVIPPLDISQPMLNWPSDQSEPSLSTSLISHAPTEVTARLGVSLQGVRDQFIETEPVPTGETRKLSIPLPNLKEGKRYRGTLTMDSRQDGRRDKVEKPLDITILSASRVATGKQPDWSTIAPIDFSQWDPFGGPLTAEDCSATLQSAYSDRGLYLRIVVRDDEQVQTSAPESMWSQDAIQIGLDPDYQKTWEANDLFGLKGHRVFEYGIGWNGTPSAKPMTWRWISYVPELPVDVAEPRIQLNVSRQGDLTTYEAFFPWSVVGLDKAPPTGSAIGLALAVSDSDTGKKGKRYLRLFGGITEGKDPEKYGPIWLR
jgi:hypothetical protein